ncbi:AAA-like domain-containing protein [Georgenia wangjunii]|uniref:AAA-like domain-containing protein n=1 Tax=Georgenia wangjunii TaxID=3117730 RepID=UPI002F268E13
MGDFVVGGVVPVSNVTYRHRQFEDECLRLLASGDWVTLLGPRQHGKTSGLVRLRDSLEENGIRAALVDLQGYPSPPKPTLEHFLSWLVGQVAHRLGAQVPAPVQIDTVLEGLRVAFSGLSGTVALLVDEATRLEEGVRHDFYSQLRAYHTATRTGDATGVAAQILFVFSGTFRPETVIDDDNSPFNVSRLVLSEDLSEDQVIALARATGDDSLVPWAQRAFAAVGGMPYLVQALLDAVSAEEEVNREQAFNSQLLRLGSGADGHLPALFRRLAAEAGAEELLGRVIASGVDGLPSSGEGLSQFLQILGAVRIETSGFGASRMYARSEFYERAFRASPQISPSVVLETIESSGSSEPAVLAPMQVGELDWIADVRLRGVVADLHAGAVQAANVGHSRLALAGLGAAYEGMLLALTEQMDVEVRDNARRRAVLRSGSIPTGSSRSWTLEALTLVAQNAGALPNLPSAAGDMIRDWRNLVHPDKARTQWKTEEELKPVVSIMASCITLLLQGCHSASESGSSQ